MNSEQNPQTLIEERDINDIFDDLLLAEDRLRQKGYKEERDINDIFDDLLLAEDRIRQKGYKEGFAEGCARGYQEGYQSGYAQGVQLGQELGSIYGAVVAELQFEHTEKVKRSLLQLRTAIDEFPRENDANKDIIEAVKNIRIQNKRLQVLLNHKRTTTKQTQSDSLNERKDYSF